MLRDKRKQIINYVRAHAPFLKSNYEKLDIYQGNLLPYVDKIMKKTLSPQYYETIQERILPINILQRYIDKVSTTYSKPPVRKSGRSQDFIDYYKTALDIDNSGTIADQYANLFKGYAWEPYVNSKGIPSMRELPFDRFLVMSDSLINPESATVFIKIVGRCGPDEDDVLLFVYTDEEFDAFTLKGESGDQYLIENGGLNLVGTIPFVYGKRSKSELIPTQDTDMVKFTQAIPVMLSDASGAQMYQCFSTFYGVDVDSSNLKQNPNVFWSFKSDPSSNKEPKVGVLTPTADTDKVVSFVINTFVMWLETKGVRVGSVGSIDAGNAASGIAKIIDEMDTYEIRKKSQGWFKKDEECLWNEKLPKIHNYWVTAGMVDPSKVPGMVDENPEVLVEFEPPKPMKTRTEEIAEYRQEVEFGSMTLEDAIKKLHPEYDELKMKEVLATKYVAVN